MSQIVEPKIYQGKELENAFFRPMLTGENAEALGIRVLYNMPVPTTVNLWRGASDVLKPFSSGWDGGAESTKSAKTIDLQRVKSEMGYSAADYFSMVFETIAAGTNATMDDLSGTQLEEAETQIFRTSLAESLRQTMWVGATDRANGPFNTFNGVLTQIINDSAQTSPEIGARSFITDAEYNAADAGEAMLKKIWDNAPVELKSLKGDGNLVFFVTSDIYSKYEESLDSQTLESAYIARQQGRPSLSYRGIPVVDMQISAILPSIADLPNTWIILTDKRNLALAVNTAHYPGTEVRMWYNPDEMQNRQRAVFAAGADFLSGELICFGMRL